MKMRHLCAALLLLLTAVFMPSVGMAQDGFAKCVGLASDLQRLACFDDAAKALAPSAPSAAPARSDTGTWDIEVEKNPVDDSQTVAVSQYSDEKTGLLMLRCMQGKPQVFIAWAKFLGSEATNVLTRLGEGKPDTKRWTLSTDKTATFYPGNQAAFIKDLMTTDRLVAQVVPYSASPVTAIFDLRGLAHAAGRLMETCQIR